MAKLHTQKCPNCSAPLDVAAEQASLTCHYCGTAIQVERGPAPRNANLALNVMYIDPRQAARVGRRVAGFFVVIGFLPLLIPVGIFLVPWIVKKASHAVKPLPAHCSVNEEIEIAGVTYEGTGPLIVAETNCKVHIVSSSLKGNVIVSAQGSNVKVTIESSTLDAKDTVVELGGGSTSLRVSQKSTLKSDASAILAKGNAEITLEDPAVKATDAVVRGETNVKVIATRSELTGKTGLLLGSNPDVTLKATTLRVETTAMTAESNAKLTCDACTIEGADGLRSGSNAKVRLTNKSQIVAANTAIEGRSSLDVEAEESRIESKDVAIAGDSSLKIRLTRQSVVKGGRVAIRGESSLSLVLRDSTVDGGTDAIQSRSGGQIDAVKSTIKAGQNALAFRSKPDQLSLSETTVTGAQNFNVDVGARPVLAPTLPAAGGAGAARAGVAPVGAKSLVGARPGAPATPAPVGPPPFNGDAAQAGLDAAASQANAACRSSSGKIKRAFVDPGFVADGSNAGAKVRVEKDIAAGSPEVACIERIFRGVRIPAFDEKTRPSGMGRQITLKP